MARTLLRGHQGDDVRRLQELLRQAGFDPGPIDGIFGTRTDAAVRGFQRAKGLVVDGAAGPITMAAFSPRTARSLHVGVNVVDPGAYPIRVPELKGCVNDANDMRQLAVERGFAPAVLVDGQATAQAVVAGIGAAADELRAGDFFFLTYSGHGSQMPDPTGEEPDGQDETLVLYDRQLLDDELSAVWARFRPGVRVLFLSDSCHSGTVARSVDLAYRAYSAATEETADGQRERTFVLASAAGLRDAVDAVLGPVADELYGTRAFGAEAAERQTRLAELVLPALRSTVVEPERVDLSRVPTTRNLPAEVLAADAAGRRDVYRAAKQAARAVPAGPASVLLMSGCQDNQLSLDGTRNGLFTQRFREVWASGAATTYPDLHRRIVALMPPQQTPNLFWAQGRTDEFENQRPLTL
ncbi:caspase family protein [Actinoplanes sp. NPDC051470]|uniref:caspase family protein n=1 Tax=unclassified Actinoplanes TaxID=2626549 RepID=UPI00341848D9